INAASDTGLKMIEKVVVKSVLDQYKPYIEVTKIVLQSLAKIEDVVARISALASPSEKPIGNAGNGSRPKALGYQGGQNISNAIGQLNSLNKITRSIANKIDPTFNYGNTSSSAPSGTVSIPKEST